MRHLSFIAILLAVFTTAIAQQRNTMCGTVVDEAFKAKYAARDRSGYDEINPGQRAGIRWVPVYYHLITKDDGKGGPSLKKTFESHCELNAAYQPFNIGFYIAGIDTIKSTQLWLYENDWLGYQAFNQYNVDNVCNIYINGNLPGLCGFATFPGSFSQSGGGLFLSINCIGAGTNTIQHEMGHYLGLMHTFEMSYGQEYVNGSNCATKGDLFCDTPADFLDDRTPCPYNGNQTDDIGGLYRTVIDETLYMSYFYDQCVNRFSTMQQVEMNNVLDDNDRNFLLTGHTVPNTDPLDSTYFIFPTEADTALVADTMTFRWAPIPGAQFYIFTIRAMTGSIVFADTVVKDPEFTFANVSPGRQYRYKVRGISYGNTCSEGGSFLVLKTSRIDATTSVTSPTCPGESDGQATVTPISNTVVAPYDIQWSNGVTGGQIVNVAPGTYTATITDALGGVAIVTVNVPSNDPIVATINAVGPNLNVSGTGGTPPYTYTWSNGVTGANNNNVPTTGVYTVTIVDSRGCSSTKTFDFSAPTGINDKFVTASMRVYPNPANGATNLNVELNLDAAVNASIKLVNVNGQIVSETPVNLNQGTNVVTIDIHNVAAGVYALQFSNGKQSQAQRVSILK